MSANRNMQTGEQLGEIAFIPYQITDFLDQEQLYSELAARVSARLAASSGPGRDQFLDNTLARAWYRNHLEDCDSVTRSGDEVRGRLRMLCCNGIEAQQSSDNSSEVPKPRSSTRKRFSSTRMPSTVTPSSSSKTSSSRASSFKVTFRMENAVSPFIPSGHWTRKRLQEQWDRATRVAGSASVTIVNEVDGEEVPGVPENFQYLEHGYDWGKYAPDPNFLIGCDCASNCNSADTSSCCIRHFDTDPEEFMGFWYDMRVRFLRKPVLDNKPHLRGQGLFRLETNHTLLRECNAVSRVSGVVVSPLPPGAALLLRRNVQNSGSTKATKNPTPSIQDTKLWMGCPSSGESSRRVAHRVVFRVSHSIIPVLHIPS